MIKFLVNSILLFDRSVLKVIRYTSHRHGLTHLVVRTPNWIANILLVLDVILFLFFDVGEFKWHGALRTGDCDRFITSDALYLALKEARFPEGGGDE